MENSGLMRKAESAQNRRQSSEWPWLRVWWHCRESAEKTCDLEGKDVVFSSQLFAKHLLRSLLENTVLVIKRGIRNCSHLHMRQTLPHEERILKRHGEHVAEFLTKAVERKEGKVTKSAANLDKRVDSSVSSFVRMGLISFTTQSCSGKLNKLICRNCF